MKSHRYDQVICFRSLARIFFFVGLSFFLVFLFLPLVGRLVVEWCYRLREAFPNRNSVLCHYLHLILFALSHYFWLLFFSHRFTFHFRFLCPSLPLGPAFALYLLYITLSCCVLCISAHRCTIMCSIAVLNVTVIESMPLCSMKIRSANCSDRVLVHHQSRARTYDHGDSFVLVNGSDFPQTYYPL